MGEQRLYPIGYVAKATGLSPHVIRVWERRYGLIGPQRSGTNRRLYGYQDIERLRLIKMAVDEGHRVSLLAGLDLSELQALANPVSGAQQPLAGFTTVRDQGGDPAALLGKAMDAVAALDHAGLAQSLRQAAVVLPQPLLLPRLVSPLLEKIGQLWAEGAIRIIHEHMATTVIRSLLWDLLYRSPPGQGAPVMVVATPTGQWCELGALMAAVVAADCGWDVHYFGPNLPVPEVAAAVARQNAGAVALSVVFCPDQSWLIRELDQLIKSLPAEVTAFIGGRGIEGQRDRLEQMGLTCPADLSGFAGTLTRLRADEDRR